MRPNQQLSIALVLSLIALVLMVVASIGGLILESVYQDSLNVEAALRGGDLVNLVIVAPALVAAMWMTIRGSIRGHLAWLALLTYTAYGYAYHVFGPTFNDLFLIHVATFSLASVALGLGLGAVDAASLSPRFASMWVPRLVAGFLMGAMAFMAVTYSVEVLRYTGGGELPTDVLPFAQWRVHLGYALDLSFLVPVAAIAGVLVWRTSPWGNPVAAVVLVFLCVFQLNFLGGAVFMNDAGIHGAASAISTSVISTIVFAIPAAVMLWGVSGQPRTPVDLQGL